MKKSLLIGSGLVLSIGLFAQQHKQLLKQDPKLANQSLKTSAIAQGDEPSFAQTVAAAKAKSFSPSAKITSMTEAVIGSTYYDMQTNSGVADRIWVNADGTIGATWTMETTNLPSYPNRGTGYNYFNGSTWQAMPTARIETDRTGWPNIVYTNSGKELVISHNTVASDLQLSSRTTPGTGAWTQSTNFVTSPIAGGNWWPRMVAKGDTIYVVSVTYPVASGGTLYQGLDGAITFCRSTDAGATWDIQHQIPTGLSSANFRGFGGDAYSIAAKDSVVAIVAGNSMTDLVLVKSTDAGQTWASTRILEFPIPLYDPSTTSSDVNSDGIADTIVTNDGNFCVALDNNNNAYVFYSRMRILQETPSSTYSFFPFTDGLFMWKEDPAFGVDTGGVIIAGVEDWNSNGTFDYPTPPTGEWPFGTYYCAMTSHPSAAFDASNNLYLTFSSMKETSVYSGTKVMRHTFIVSSADGGSTWTNSTQNSCDIVLDDPSIPLEGVYASIAKRVDGNVHVVYQRDYNPGYGIPPSTGTPPDPENDGQINDIVYSRVPVSDIGTCSIIPNSVQEQNGLIQSLSVYPNPSKGGTTLSLDVKADGNATVKVTNLLGQLVATYSMDVSANQANQMNINVADYSKGVYIINVSINGSSSSKKLIVE